MLNKKIMVLAIFLVSLLAISAVSAEDNVTDDIVGTDSDENIVENTNDNVYSASEDFKNKTTFGGLVYTLNYTAEGDVYLDKDYKFVGTEYDYDPNTGEKFLVVDEKGITINRNLTIHGNGHIIDANNSARFFNVLGHNVVLKDIVFVNGKDNEWNSPIVWEGNGGIVDNCTFYNCRVNCDGGVFRWDGDSGRITNCNFTDCYAYNAGAVLWNGNDGTVSNSNFDGCSLCDNAGSIKWTGERGTVDGCTFTNAEVVKGNGGAIIWEGANGTVTNSNFLNITTSSVGYTSGGGAIYWDGENAVISKSKFKDISVNWNGGAINLHNVNGTVTDCSFFNCTAGSSGGAVYIHSQNGEVLNSNFTNCILAIHLNKENGTVKNSNFFNCTTTNSGGSILVSSDNCSVYDSNFANCNSTKWASAINWDGNKGILTGCTFEKCCADDYGAILWTGNNATISDSNFTDCYARSANGGAIGINGGFKTVTISNSNFFSCCANNDAGAIIWGGGNGNVYTLNNSNFYNCSSGRYGGAISGKVNVYNSVFDECSAGESGGAMYEGSATNCNFTGNRAKWGGAKHSTNGATVNCIFIGNVAGDYAGAVYGNAIDNCIFADNYAEGRDGGALYGVQMVSNSDFTNCHANKSGGAIYKADSVINCSFNNCSGANEGGAIRWDGYQGLVNNSNFNDCSAAKGGAIYWTGNAGLISNSNFTRCSASENGGAFSGSASVANCSFVENHAEGRGGAMASGSVRDSTFWYNTASQDNNWYDTRVPNLNLNVVNFNSVYGSGDAIFLNATEGDIAVNDVIITVRASKNDKSFNGTFDCLTNTDWTVDLDAGVYTAKMAVEHHAYNLDKSITLTITQRPTNITAVNVSTTYGLDDYLTVTLRDFEGNNVSGRTISVDLNGVKTYVTDENGQIRVPVKGVPAGDHVALITFNGTGDNYATSTASANVSVAKSATLISADAVTTVYNGGKYLVATLKDAYGNPIVGAKVVVNINSPKTLVSDKSGQVKLTTDNIAAKSYDAKITFAGDANYLASSFNVKVTIKKAAVKLTAKKKTFKKSVKTKKYSVTLKDNKGKAIKKAKLTLKVKGKTYKATTNAKGVATFKITKLTKKGKHKATVKYAGSAYYKGITKKYTVKVK